MGAGITAALTIYFNTYFWELSSQQMSLLAMLNFVSAAVAFAVTPQLSLRYGKRAAAIGSALIVIIFGPAPIFLRLLGLFPDNGSPLLLPTLAVVNTIAGHAVHHRQHPDHVDAGGRRRGQRGRAPGGARRASSSPPTRSYRSRCPASGIFASTLLLNAIDFPRGAQPGSVVPEVVRNLGLVYAPTFVVLFMLMLVCVAAYRISRASHEANLQRLGR